MHIYHVGERTQGWRERCIKTFQEKKYSFFFFFFFFFVLTPYASPFLVWEAVWILILKGLGSDDTAPDDLPPADTIQLSLPESPKYASCWPRAVLSVCLSAGVCSHVPHRPAGSQLGASPLSPSCPGRCLQVSMSSRSSGRCHRLQKNSFLELLRSAST